MKKIKLLAFIFMILSFIFLVKAEAITTETVGDINEDGLTNPTEAAYALQAESGTKPHHLRAAPMIEDKGGTNNTMPTPNKPLVKGGHAISVIAVDKSGNQSRAGNGSVNIHPKKSGIFTNHGVAIKSVSTFSGVFTKNEKNDKVYYGVTRSGEFCRLFRYNLSSQKVDLVVPIEEAKGAWGITLQNNMVYVGTYFPASFYRYDIRKNVLTKISTFQKEQYIWHMDVYEGNVYIAASPTSSVMVYNIQSEEISNLEPMSKHKYSRSLEFYQNTMFVGIGASAQLIEYDMETGNKKNILPPEFNDYSFVYHLQIIGTKLFVFLDIPSFDVLVYDLISKEFILHAEKVDAQAGIFPTFSDEKIHLTGIKGWIFEYDKKQNTLYRLASDRLLAGAHIVDNTFIAGVTRDAVYVEILFDGQIRNYFDLSTAGLEPTKALPMSIMANDNKVFIAERQLRIFDVESGAEKYKLIPNEAKDMCFIGNSVITANYPKAKIWRYPETTIEEPNSDLTDHIQFFLFDIEHAQNRPKKIIANQPDNFILIGTEPDYGQYGGALTYYDLDTKERYTYRNIVRNHTIHEMTFDESAHSIVYLGSSAYGGTGTDPLDEDAHVLKWDVYNKKILFDIVPEIDNKRILSISHSGNKLYVTTHNYNLYLISSITGEIILKNTSSKVFKTMYSVDGNLYGIYKDKFFIIDKLTLEPLYYGNKFNSLRYLIEDKMKNKIYLIDGYNLWSFE